MGVVVRDGQMWRGRIPRDADGVLCRFAVRLAGDESVSYATDLPAAVGVVIDGYVEAGPGERARMRRAVLSGLQSRVGGERVAVDAESEWGVLVGLVELGLAEVSMRP